MKKTITILALACSVNAVAAQKICGITVQDKNILQDREHLGFNFAKNIFLYERAKITQCFMEKNGPPALVATFDDGEITAIIFY